MTSPPSCLFADHLLVVAEGSPPNLGPKDENSAPTS